MVASHRVEDTVRAFVRVPGSGSKKSAKPSICNLAKVSTLASRIFVPNILPAATNVLTQSPSTKQVSKGRKRPRKEEIYDLAPKTKDNKMDTTKATPVKIIPVTLMAVRIPNAEIQKLIAEIEQLRKQKEKLREQLSLFKQLIRNPQRLNSVLCRLEEKGLKT